MQQGISLYLTMVILSVLSAALLGLISISISQIKIIGTIGNSAAAFYTADSGIEQALYRIRQENNFSEFSGSIGEASYDVSISIADDEMVIKSVGSYRKTKRAIQAR